MKGQIKELVTPSYRLATRRYGELAKRHDRLIDRAQAAGSGIRLITTLRQAKRLLDEGKLADAYEVAEKATALTSSIAQNLDEGHSPDELEPDMNVASSGLMGEILLELGDISRAIPALELGARVYRSKGLDNPKAALRLFRSLSIAHRIVGEKEIALSTYLEGVAMYQAGQDKAREAVGRFTPAALADKIFARDADLASALLELADLYLELDRVTDARQVLDRINPRLQELPRKNRPVLACRSHLLATRSHLMERNHEAAEIELNEAKRFVQSARLPHDLEGDCLLLASELALARSSSSTVDLHVETVRFMSDRYGEKSLRTLEARTRLAGAYMKGDMHRQAFRLLLDVCAGSPLWDVISVVGESQRLQFTRLMYENVDKLLQVAETCSLTTDEEAEVAATLFQSRGASTEVDVTVRRSAATSVDSEERFKRIVELRRRVGERTLRGPGPEGVPGHERVLEAWTRERRELEADLARNLTSTALSESADATLHSMQASLAQDETIVEICGYGRQPSRLYVAILMSRESVRLIWLGDGRALDDAANEFRRLLAGAGGQAQIHRAGLALRTLLDPVLRLVAEKYTSAHIAADGPLSLTPIEMIPDEAGVLLFERVGVAHLSTARDLYRLRRRTVAPPRSEAIVLGAPNFDMAADQTPPTEKHFEDLEEVVCELQGVADLLGVTPILGNEATRERVLGCQGPAVLHLATHGYTSLAPDDGDIRTAEEYLRYSGLAFAGANTQLSGGGLPSTIQGALLSAEDILSLDLIGTKLVVMSACSTGVGVPVTGEGVFGVRRALLIAGASTLIVSLWEVVSDATVELMTEFYRAINSAVPALDALRQAQAHVRQKRPHPVNWAGFILVGDGLHP